MGNRVIGLSSIGLVYASLAALIVHAEAEAYRGALLSRREAARLLVASAPTDPTEPPNATTEAAPDSKLESPPPPITETVPESRPVEAPAVAPPPVVAVAPVPPPVEAPRPAPLPVLIVPDLEKLPVADEAKLGSLLHELIRANHVIDENGPERRVISEAVRPLLNLHEPKDVEISIYVLDSNEVNAFSHIGGYVYVTRGLFNLVASPEQFIFVVGHELAHLERRDAQKLVAEATRDGRAASVGTLQSLYHQIAEGFTKTQEFEADAWIADRMQKLEISKKDTLAFMRKLANFSEENGFRNGGKPPKTPLAAPVQEIDNHFRSQPAAWERLERLEARFKAPAPTAPAR